MIPQLIEAAVSLVGGVVRAIGAAGLSEEVAQKHIDDLFARLDATRAEVHAEAEETKAIAEGLK
jgi:hypothetical protein